MIQFACTSFVCNLYRVLNIKFGVGVLFEENEAYMLDMINTDGRDNGTGTEEGTQAGAYEIDGRPLFDVPSANATATYADGQEEEESENEEDAEAD
jgi:hypothetical protein